MIIGRLAGESRIKFRHRLFAGGINEQTGDAVEKIIAGRAGDRPVGGQFLAGFENFLDRDPGAGRGLTQSVQVLFRIVQAVRVINAQASPTSRVDTSPEYGCGNR